MRWPHFRIAGGLFLVAACVLLGCSVLGQSISIRGYQVVDEDTISVLATTADGWETWVSSVQESPARLVVEVRTRPPQGAGVFPCQDLWLTVDLDSSLGDRPVFDAAANALVPLVP
jgi:hypothetical protein